MTRWLVDGNNVMGSRPDGWWKDRPGAARRLAGEVAALCHQNGESAVVVFDGRPPPGQGLPGGVPPYDVAEPTAGFRVLFAGVARGAADDEIVRLVTNDKDPGGITVVTSDKGLVERVRPKGPRVMGAGDFLGLLRTLTDETDRI